MEFWNTNNAVCISRISDLGFSTFEFRKMRMLFSTRASLKIFRNTSLKIHSAFDKYLRNPRSERTKLPVRPAKTQISLGIQPVWSESSLSSWINTGPYLPIACIVKTLIRLGGCPDWSESSPTHMSFCRLKYPSRALSHTQLYSWFYKWG